MMDKYAFHDNPLDYIDQEIEQLKNRLNNLNELREQIVKQLAQKAIQESINLRGE